MKSMVADTSGKEIALGLFDDRKLLAEKHLTAEQKYNKILADSITAILKEAGMKFADIDVFAACAGPGSFTGIRVGMATMKGFAQSLDRKFYSVSTLDLMAWAAVRQGVKGRVVPVMDARRGEIYTAAYSIDNSKAERVSEYSMTTAQALEKNVSKGSALCIMESEAPLFGEFFDKHQAGLIRLKENDMSAFNEILLHNRKDLKKENIFTMEPLYIRKSEAEVTMLNKLENERRKK